jgi:hypothetical protein
MPEEGFLRRWARRKTEVREGRATEPASAPEPELERVPEPAVTALAEQTAPAPAPVPAPTPAPAPALPTMEDVAALGADSDFSSFVARGVDQAVRRSALKKLFADPHFNVMDKLDVYIDDYTKPSPMSEAMLASLSHAKSVFMRVIEDDPEAQAAPPEPEAEQAAPLQQPPEEETQ